MSIASLKRQARRTLWSCSPSLYRRLLKPHCGQTFSIGILRGATLFNLSSSSGMENPVLTRDDVLDVPAAFVADPFLLHRDGIWHMFFEVLNSVNRRGEIGLATSVDGRHWRYQQIVLRESFHLAYPYVFAFNDEIYMVPDTPESGIRLYRARRFPTEWVLETTLREDNQFSDSSIFSHDGRWWMLSGWKAKPEDPMSLRLFHAEAPTGPWLEHPSSPVVTSDDNISRPAGRVQKVDGELYRFAQDCRFDYGSSVRVFHIEQLSVTSYTERRMTCNPFLQGGDDWWNSGGMHHVDAHPMDKDHWLACVDGWYA